MVRLTGSKLPRTAILTPKRRKHSTIPEENNTHINFSDKNIDAIVRTQIIYFYIISNKV